MIELQRPRVVLDCMVYLQAVTRERGPAAEVLRWCEQERLALFISPAIMKEIGEVLRRPVLRRKFRSLTDARVQEFLSHLTEVALLVAEVPKRVSLERDPRDEGYLNLALAVEARYLITWDNDLLDLMEDTEFVQRHPFLTILTPPDLLRNAAGE